ncbi:winged helix-turn-helix domain-containing protein [Aeromonas veronii]|uniref:winged helix-turn-helix domain-containing protein n=1 Tax=Aeromonas veronii TaxID=654 RepID=UPI002A74F9A9|nr:winged helix-turn-helix transcriptional regulator [Aeromonas veronii]
MNVLRLEPHLTLAEVAERIGKSARTVERSASALVKEGRLRFVGPRKSGRWEVLNPDA